MYSTHMIRMKYDGADSCTAVYIACTAVWHRSGRGGTRSWRALAWSVRTRARSTDSSYVYEICSCACGVCGAVWVVPAAVTVVRGHTIHKRRDTVSICLLVSGTARSRRAAPMRHGRAPRRGRDPALSLARQRTGGHWVVGGEAAGEWPRQRTSGQARAHPRSGAPRPRHGARRTVGSATFGGDILLQLMVQAIGS